MPGQRKMTDDQVRDVRRALARGESERQVAAAAGVTRRAIEHIKANRSYRDVQLPIGEYRVGDALTEMRKIPDGEFRCVVTSPPYNKGLGQGAGTSHWGGHADFELAVGEWDTYNYQEYVEWQLTIIEESLRIVGDRGLVCYNTKHQELEMGLDLRAGILSHPSLRQIVIWDKRSAIPMGGAAGAATILPTSHEIIALFAGRNWTIPKGQASTESKSWRTVWQIPPSTAGESGHPASFPEELARRCILLGGGAVLDPFAGSGTVGVVAKQLGVPCLLIDLEERYRPVYEERLRGPQTHD